MTKNKEYLEFLKTKLHSYNNYGFEAKWYPNIAFDFQKHIIHKNILKGRYADFIDTGLGKTLMQLSTAYNVVLHTNKRVLIICPLAVAFQFVKEAEKIGIDDIEYSKEGKFTKKIVLCNYERLHYFNSSDFECVILDESSILKNFKGQTKTIITSFLRKTPYRYLATATPSPNDFIELGTSSEALGYMGYMDMLSKFFKNNSNTSDSNNRNIGEKYYLKPHAEKDFFKWVNQWAIMARMPSDLGYSDDGYVLPKLHVHDHVIRNQSMINKNGQILLLTPIAKTNSEILFEQKQTINERCAKAVELSQGKTSVYWCNLNQESDLLKKLDSEAVELRGEMSIEKKEDILISFANGDIKRLITKADITGFGLNWQHCNHTTYFPTFSYEKYYQAIRRFWRFGQKNEVEVHRIISDGQTRVTEAITQKTEKASQLYTSLIENVNSSFELEVKPFDKQIKLPKFLCK